MGMPDLFEKRFLMHNEVFAEVWNKLGRGSFDIDPSELTDGPTEQVNVNNGIPKSSFRDVVKHYHGTALRLAILGIENQTAVDKMMPLRVMNYDCGIYRSQVSRGMKPVPAFTKVLYYGYNKPWDGPRTLSQMIGLPPEFLGDFSDYEIQVIELAWLSDEDRCRLTGSVRGVADVFHDIRTSCDLRGDERWVNLPYEVIGLINSVTHMNLDVDKIYREIQKENGGARMCEIIEKCKAKLIAEHKDEWLMDGIQIGQERGMERGIQIGQERGIQIGQERNTLNIVRNMIAMHMSFDVISQATGMNAADIQKLAAETCA